MKCIVKYEGEELMTLTTDHNVYDTLKEFGYHIWYNGLPGGIISEYDLDADYIEIIPL